MSAALWFFTGLFIGAAVGFFAAVLLMAAKSDLPWEKSRPDPEDEEN